jgi:hypothetical protein
MAVGAAFLGFGDVTEVRRISLDVAIHIAPLKAWGGLFVLSGFLAVISAKWPSFSDSWGYAVLCGVSSAWSTMYLASYIFGAAPASNITYALVWGLVAFLWWAISGLINPDKVIKLVVSDGLE